MKLYGLKTCTACIEAEKLLESNGYEYEYIEPEEDIGVLPQLEINGVWYNGLGRIRRFIREGY